jgi:hypothetical protein
VEPYLNFSDMFPCSTQEKFCFPLQCPSSNVNPLNAQLNPTCHLLALLGAHHILHDSRIGVNSHLGNREICCILCNPNIHYHVHKSVQLIHILSRINPLHTLTICMFGTYFRDDGGGEVNSTPLPTFSTAKIL